MCYLHNADLTGKHGHINYDTQFMLVIFMVRDWEPSDSGFICTSGCKNSKTQNQADKVDVLMQCSIRVSYSEVRLRRSELRRAILSSLLFQAGAVTPSSDSIF